MQVVVFICDVLFSDGNLISHSMKIANSDNSSYKDAEEIIFPNQVERLGLVKNGGSSDET